MKEKLYELIQKQQETLFAMADQIHDDSEYDGEEYHASAMLEDYLEQHGFQVERGLENWPTAFRATWGQGDGGPRIGLLCEYDALRGLGHGCGHHMQGPCICATAIALKEAGFENPFQLVVYGTPAEETRSAKVSMWESGYFRDMDVALMMHGGPDTCVDEKSLALTNYLVVFKGQGAHAALAPEKGRSALDALLLAFNGMEFLREHVREDTRMHYTIKETPGPTNVVPARAVGEFSLRSYSREVLNDVCRRFEQIIQGAALMADVEYEITKEKSLDNKVPCYPLNEIIMDNAAACGAPGLAPVRKKTGSTDFGNVTNHMPGCCIRVKFVPTGTSSHTQAFVDAGKSQEAHDAILYGAKTLAGTACDLICQPERVKELWDAFEQAKANA
ncbi:M20 family metallopeptidase [Pseudoflavonifractor phocaeensis]|nr:M20 family metallopeptidase [Pseudoflavonifractor phocaeensis]MCF2676205.1 M20 family metallopeptidase [Pseudoflavonifractor phocaeensis]